MLRSLIFTSQCLGKRGKGGGGGGGGGDASFHRIFFDDYVFKLPFLMFSGFFHRFGH